MRRQQPGNPQPNNAGRARDPRLVSGDRGRFLPGRGVPPQPRYNGGPGRYPPRGSMPLFRGGPPGRGGPMRGGPRDMGRMGRGKGFLDGGRGRGPIFGRHPPPPPPRMGSSDGRGMMQMPPPRPPPPPPPLRTAHGGMATPQIPPPPIHPPPPPFGVNFPPPVNNFHPQIQQQPYPFQPMGTVPAATNTTAVHSLNPAQIPPLPPFASVPVAGVVIAAAPQTGLAQNQESNGIAASIPPTAQQIDQAWTEYTSPSGVKYYHNHLLKQSTYTKPAVMMQPEPIATSIVSNQKRTWQEYTDASTGRKYYSDGVTTTWEKPEGFISPEDIVAKTSSKDEANNEPKKKKKRGLEVTGSYDAKNELISFGSKQEAVSAFKGLLLAKGVAPSLKWNEVVKLCEGDPRWGARWEACSEVLSVGERRQALAEFQTKRANEILNEERQERARSKEAFGQMLAEVLPKMASFSSQTSRFEDVRSALAKDDRFFVIDDEGLRETLFLDFCDDFRKREERNKRSKKKEAEESFLSFLQEKEEVGLLTIASTWESFLSSLPETEKADSRFATSVVLPDSDRQLYFADFVLDLQRAEDDKRRRIRDARRRAEKAQRDNYRALLSTLAKEGSLLPYSRWRMVEELLVPHESFSLVQAQGRDMPRELFEEFADEWDDRYRRERSFLARLIEHPDGSSFTKERTTTYEAFKDLVIKEASYSDDAQDEAYRIINREDPVSSAQLYYQELLTRPSDFNRPGRSSRIEDESSEDEGEIIEDEGEANNEGNQVDGGNPKPNPPEAGPEQTLHMSNTTVLSDRNETNQEASQDAGRVDIQVSR
ncbi:FF domain containing protein [Nitzschia inconspicua]|uniref:FF domain containing protein n=1 Tax=Nitzschia inconspicua TaxID=303405 RepID=A0A9K3KEX2_9STRA|nr:FF domain containing protein [Nitzschia inconspicua]